MTTSTANGTAALRSDEIAVAQYRTISRAALGSVVLALASALVLANLLFAPIALAAMATAAMALRSIASSSGQIVGRPLALASLGTAAFFLGWGASWQFARQAALENQARQVAEGWLALISAGKLKHAHQLTVGAHRRVEGDQAIDRLYRNEPEAMSDLNRWFNEEPLKSFTALGRKAEFEFESVASSVQAPEFDHLTLKYLFFPADDRSRARPMWISVQRNLPLGAEPPDWKVMHVSHRAP